MLRIPWVNRLKSKCPAYVICVASNNALLHVCNMGCRELGVNTAWPCGVALAIQVGTIIIIKFTNAEDFWEEYKEF